MFLRVVLLLAATAQLTSARPSVATDWQYLVFTQEWPPTFCLEQKGSKGCDPRVQIKTWNVHGLWPTGGSKSEYCKGNKFDPKALDPISGQLKQYWVDLFNASSTEFYGYEWKKHGKCATTDSQLGDELKYFNATVQIRKHLDVGAAFTNSKIYPNAQEGYEPKDLLSALKKTYGVEAIVKCYIKGDKVYLREVRICVSQSLQPIDCPDADTLIYRKYAASVDPTKCSGRPGPVIIPPF